MQFQNVLLVAFLGIASTGLACNMHEWKMPEVPKEGVKVQGANMPIPDGAGGKKKMK